MDKIHFEKIDQDNFFECIDEVKVSPEQKHFVAPNIFSLAQCHVHPEYRPLAIYAGEKMIGFAMYGIAPDDGQMWILRLMMDKDQQNKGYGRKALRLLLEKLQKEDGCESVQLSYEPENRVAEQFYLSEGFQQTGKKIYGENIMRYTYS